MSEQYMEKAYWGKDVANRLGIGRSTLTKWCLALENKKYSFVRGENKNRVFTEQDILVLQYMKELVQTRNLTLNTAVNVLLSRIIPGRTGSVHEENSLFKNKDNYPIQLQFKERETEKMPFLFKHLETMATEFIEMKQELQNIKAQNEYLKEVIQNQEKQQMQVESDRFDKENKRDEQLMLLFREMQETKKMLATTEQKKSFWNRLFSK